MTPLAVGIAAAALAWWVTTRPMLLALDWDNAFHHWQIEHMFAVGRDSCGHGRTLWTCGYTAHMALEPLYGAGALGARWGGGDVLDGMRAVNAIAVGIAAAFLAAVARHAGAAMWATALIAAAWLTTSDAMFLMRTIEDDCILLACTGAILFLCVRAPVRWNSAVAVLAGFVLAVGALANYAALVWTPVVVIAGTLYARRDIAMRDSRRLLWAFAIAFGFAAGVASWGLWLHELDGEHWSWARYGQVITTSPNSEILSRHGTIDGVLRYIAVYSLDTVLPGGWYPAQWLSASSARWRILGVGLDALAMFGTMWPLRRGRLATSNADVVVSVASLALLVCTLPAAWKGDFAQYERMDHVPFCLAAIAGALLSGVRLRDYVVLHDIRGQCRRARGAPFVLAIVAAVLAINVQDLARAPRGQSWLARFEATRRRHPQATTFVFAESEFDAQAFDKLESLKIAIPNHVVISPKGDIRRWPFTPVTHMMLSDYVAMPAGRPWMSDAAQAVVQR